MTKAEAIDRVVNIALSEEGYCEKASANNLNDKYANAGSGNYTKYGRDMHNLQPSNMDYPAAWCDAFVDWCFYKAFGADLARKVLCGDFDDYTVNSAGYYKAAGRWTSKPKRGHQIFFQDYSGGICHTGLVYQVSNGTVFTIEGNSSNAVRKCSYMVGSGKIAGYGNPRYNLVSGEPVDPAPDEPVDQYAGTCQVTLPTMIEGSRGEAVKSLQVLLNAKGYKGADGKVLDADGEYGANTAYAVEQLQRSAGMQNIYFGTVANLTWDKLING